MQKREEDKRPLKWVEGKPQFAEASLRMESVRDVFGFVQVAKLFAGGASPANSFPAQLFPVLGADPFRSACAGASGRA
jgi:hypothetical protein